MRLNRNWTVSQADPRAEDLAHRLRTSALVAQILLNRGLADLDDCARFLQPQLKSLHEPSLLPGCAQAAQRIAGAIRDRQKIVIYGDYDVDGITATAILWHAIRTLGGTADYYIPHRIEEGYGLNAAAIEKLCDDGAQLLVTVDCGITALAPAQVARNRRVDLIITDHHEWLATDGAEPSLPACHCIVHPRLPVPGVAPYPNPHLCGAGVALKLAWAIGQAVNGSARVSDSFREFLIEAMSLAALGTIADVVPLIGENRVLAHYGLTSLPHGRLSGIRALVRAAGLDGQTIDSYDVGFRLAPRLNAAGRMGHAQLAAELLTSADAARSEEIATFLEQQNRQRQAAERSILREALEQATQRRDDSPDSRCVVLASNGWHPGVIGIVASRLVDRLNKPAVLVSLGHENGAEKGAASANGQTGGRGSGRSIAGFHLVRALQACAEHLDGFGGHEMAAGLRVQPEKFEDFRTAFQVHANQAIAPELLIPKLHLDAEARLDQMTDGLVSDLKRLGPFGQGNRRPLLCLRALSLAGPPRRVGKTGEHLQLFVRQGEARMKCIAFGAGEWFEKLKPGIRVDLAAEPQFNDYNGRVTVELFVKDVRIAEN
jgi:single-stranded-DNA-specific exonuclease